MNKIGVRRLPTFSVSHARRKFRQVIILTFLQFYINEDVQWITMRRSEHSVTKSPSWQPSDNYKRKELLSNCSQL